MKNKLLFTSTIFLLFLIPIDNSYGHGLGIDTARIDIDGKKISVSVEIPDDFDESQEKIITITAIDEDTKETAKNVTFLIGLSHENQMIFRNYFFTENGNLLIHVLPTEQGETRIVAEKDSLLGAWYETDSQPIQLIGPVFKSGGLFNFEIELRTIDEPTNIVENLGTYHVDVSITDITDYVQQDKNGENINFKIKSYFDKISEFNYDFENNIITFKMPFNWNEKTISHIPVVHEEIHIPKNFSGFLSPSYSGKINGIDLFRSNVIIDDYSDDTDRIVHFVLLQDHLQYINQEQKKLNDDTSNFMVFTLEVSDKIEFPMNAQTRDEKFQVDLSWDPIEIEPNKNTKFIFTIRDAKSGEPLRQSSYDFVILQNNIEIYRTSGNAQVGGNTEDYTFLDSQTGLTVIRFENIRGTGSSTEFGIVVVPEFGFFVLFVLSAGLFTMIIFNKKFFNQAY
jgi:predicted secreted protein with PEFG-CTERM motif